MQKAALEQAVQEKQMLLDALLVDRIPKCELEWKKVHASQKPRDTAAQRAAKQALQADLEEEINQLHAAADTVREALEAAQSSLAEFLADPHPPSARKKPRHK